MLIVEGKLRELDSVLDNVKPHVDFDALTIPQIDLMILSGKVTEEQVAEHYETEYWREIAREDACGE